MKILITTPLYPPEIGGPAHYAFNLKREFEKKGNEVRLVNFPKKLPSILRHVFFMGKVKLGALSSNVIFSLDHFSVGLPSAIVSLFFRKKLFVRVGGDFLWEQYVNRTKNKITIKEFNQNLAKLNIKERIIFRASKFVFRRANKIIFSTTWQRDIFLKPYNIDLAKTEIIENYFSPKESLGVKLSKKEFVWAGRMIPLKNLDLLIKAFVKFSRESEEAWGLRLIGDGAIKKDLIKQIKENNLGDIIIIEDSVSKDKIKEVISSAWATIIPSLSEVSSNFLIESLSLTIPSILSRENGYAKKFIELGIFVNPKSKEEMYEAIKEMSRKSIRDDYVQRIENTNFIEQSWQDMAWEYLNIFKA